MIRRVLQSDGFHIFMAYLVGFVVLIVGEYLLFQYAQSLLDAARGAR